MSILAWVIVGLVAGLIANIVYPRPARGGWFGAMVLGIAGAIVGGFLSAIVTGQDLVSGVNLTTMMISVIGALVLLFAYNAIANPGSRAS